MPLKKPNQLNFNRVMGFTLIGLGFCATVKVATQPLIANPKTSLLPAQVELNHWQFTKANVESSVADEVSYDQLLQAKAYEYIHQDKQMKLQLGYFFNTNGDVLVLRKRLETLHDQADSTDTQWVEQSQVTTGRYLTRHLPSGETVLLTCINAAGANTVNREQFSDNRLQHDISVSQVFSWLAGRSQFLDKRCLWTRLSLNGFDSNEKALQEATNLLHEMQPKLSNIL